MVNKNTFVSRNERNKYKLYNRFKSKTRNLYAEILNSTQYLVVKKVLINLAFTTLIVAIILFCFKITNPLRFGFGIAVTLAITQKYFEWYCNKKEKYKKVYILKNK